jgi:hypothetical protein
MSDPVFTKIRSHAPDKESCKRCHDPKVKDGGHEGISCIGCHTIQSIRRGHRFNQNVYSQDKRTLYSAEKGREGHLVRYHEESSWLGLSRKTVGSPYHDIDYRDKIYYNGQVCMGCHSHKRNGAGLLLCSAEASKREGKSCIDCHMPRVPGSATSIRMSDRHRYHGFDGFAGGMRKMGRYVDLKLERVPEGVEITLRNRAPHKLFTHPLRLLELRCQVRRGGKLIAQKSYRFMRTLGKKGHPTPPWAATEVLKDTMLPGEGQKRIVWKVPLQAGDSVEAVLHVRQVLPAAAKKFGLKGATQPRILKEVRSTF